MDDYNYDAFYLSNEKVFYYRVVEGEIVGRRYSDVKIFKRLKEHELSVKSSFNKLEFYVNNVKALEIRNAPVNYSGLGFGVWAEDGKQTADVDYIEFIQ